MSDKKPELSTNIKALGKAIRDHGTPVQAVFCGFDLWLEVMGSGHTSMCDFLAGGKLAEGTEDEKTLKVPVLVIGGRIVVNFAPTIPPDRFYVKP